MRRRRQSVLSPGHRLDQRTHLSQPFPDRLRPETAALVVSRDEHPIPHPVRSVQDEKNRLGCQEYWDLFTSEYGVEPDADNWHQMLKVLRKGHGSAKGRRHTTGHANKADVGEGTFRVAFRACLLDNINPNVMRNANAILELMVETLKVPDTVAASYMPRVATRATTNTGYKSRPGPMLALPTAPSVNRSSQPSTIYGRRT